MRSTLKLTLEHLAVESHPTTDAPKPKNGEERIIPQATCLQTACPPYVCCA